jgi:nitrogenase molybdenum-iron protein alpha chain
MNYLNQKAPPIREERLKACEAFGGSASCLVRGSKIGCLAQTSRSFVQSSGCQFTLSLAIIATLQDSVIILHGPLGCGIGTSMMFNGILKINQTARGIPPRGVQTVTTNLTETDVISGGEPKLRQTILEVDKQYKPRAIFIVSSCVPAIIGDDIDLVASELQGQVSARLLTMHCEGFKTKIQATAYDAVYHAILRGLFDIDNDTGLRTNPSVPVSPTPRGPDYEERRKKTVNLLNVASMSLLDEIELRRLLTALGLNVNVYPCYSKPDDFVKATDAAVSVSICPTHDDYFLRHLEELYGVPAVIGTIPIGLGNTRKWLLDVARFFGIEQKALQLIEAEESAVREALAPVIAPLKGKTVFVCAGEFRAAAAAVQFEQDYGMKLVGVRAFHYDAFAEEIFASLPRRDDVPVNIAPWQPFEQSNLLRRLKPDLFVGHVGGNVWAAKDGFASIPIFSPSNAYMGYKGAFDMGTRIERTLRNPSFNRNISKHVSLPYQDRWYDDSPFKYIRQEAALAAQAPEPAV